MTQQRHWIDNIADLVSGRYHNTLVSLHNRLTTQENIMTQNEQTILQAAQDLRDAKTRIDDAVTLLKEKAEEHGVAEDLSEELAELTPAVGGIGATATSLTPAPAGTPATGGGSTTSTDATNDSPLATPIDHADPVVTPLAGSSGPTDAGVPTEVVPPGVAAGDEQPMTPKAEDAQVEANPNLPASEDSVPVAETPVAEDDADMVEDDDDADPEADEDADPNAQFEDDED